MNDGRKLNGSSEVPQMNDKEIVFLEIGNNTSYKISSEKAKEIVFITENDSIVYEQVLTYKNYGNKKINKKSSWLKVVKEGQLSLYYGYRTNYNQPAMNMWYYKKENDSIAFFVSVKYSGGLVITAGHNSGFVKNSIRYLSDYEKLVLELEDGLYKLKDIETVVERYNKWVKK